MLHFQKSKIWSFLSHALQHVKVALFGNHCHSSCVVVSRATCVKMSWHRHQRVFCVRWHTMRYRGPRPWIWIHQQEPGGHRKKNLEGFGFCASKLGNLLEKFSPRHTLGSIPAGVLLAGVLPLLTPPTRESRLAFAPESGPTALTCEAQISFWRSA